MSIAEVGSISDRLIYWERGPLGGFAAILHESADALQEHFTDSVSLKHDSYTFLRVVPDEAQSRSVVVLGRTFGVPNVLVFHSVFSFPGLRARPATIAESRDVAGRVARRELKLEYGFMFEHGVPELTAPRQSEWLI